VSLNGAVSRWAIAGFLVRWEAVLVLLLIIVTVAMSLASPFFLDFDNLIDNSLNSSEEAMIALPMAILIISREIDVSVASIVALAAVLMGLTSDAGGGVVAIVLVGLATGLVAGVVNGALVTGLGIHSIVVTIGTLSLYRGIATAIVTDGAFTKFPKELFFFGRYYVGGTIPFELIFLALLILLFGACLHTTVVGRRIFAIGNSPEAARYSGVAVTRYKVVVFALTGLISGVASVFLVSRLGSVRSNIAQGWELQIITMVVLGGVAISGGTGNIFGVVLSVLLIEAFMFGLSLLNIPGIIINMCLGFLLIAAICAPYLIRYSLPVRGRDV
jgi:rhamnose transport system permease protein